MDDQRIGRVILILRQRRGWRQADLAAKSGVSQSAISEIERGRIDRYTLRSVRTVLRAMDGTAVLDVTWGGRGDLDRLLDADHSRLMQLWASPGIGKRAGTFGSRRAIASTANEGASISSLSTRRPAYSR